MLEVRYNREDVIPCTNGDVILFVDYNSMGIIKYSGTRVWGTNVEYILFYFE